MQQPLIGITSGFSYDDNLYFLNRYYTQAIYLSGGIPLILPAEDPSLAAEYYNLVDGLIFSGGGDLDPCYFGEEPERALGEINPLRDMFEWHLAQIAIGGRKPVLGICRGLQILNIAAGGSVYQDLAQFTKQGHQQRAPKWQSYHSLRIAIDSHLFQVIGQEQIRVNSFHHQAVKKLGKGLKAVAWSEDMIIEALEGEENQGILGVQWHPECLFEKDKFAKSIFRNLIKSASQYPN